MAGESRGWLTAVADPGAAEGAGKPSIVILATGGTIAGAAETERQAGYSSGQIGVDVLMKAVPQKRTGTYKYRPKGIEQDQVTYQPGKTPIPTNQNHRRSRSAGMDWWQRDNSCVW